MSWLIVITAAASEILGTFGLSKFSRTKTFQAFSIFAGGFVLSFSLLYLSFRFLPISTAYAVWIGLGTAGAAVINMICFKESAQLGRVGGIALIVAGTVGLKFFS